MKLFFLSLSLLCNLQNKVRMLHTRTRTTPKDHRYVWKCNTPFLFPLLLLSSCLTLPQFKSPPPGFVSQRTKFVPPPTVKYTLTRHQTVVCKSRQEVQGRFGSWFTVNLRVQSVDFGLQTYAVFSSWLSTGLIL